MNNHLKKDLNLFAAVGKERGLGAVDFEKSLKKCLLVFAAIFGVVLIIALGVNGVRKSKIEKLNAQIEELQAPLKEIDQLKQESEALQRDIDKFNEAIAAFSTTPRLTTEDIKNIARCMPAGLVLTNFSYGGSSISLSVTGTTELMIADFANNLRNSVTINKEATTEAEYNKKNFKNVMYTGVSKNGSTYTGSITIDLNDIVTEETTEAPVETTTAEE